MSSRVLLCSIVFFACHLWQMFWFFRFQSSVNLYVPLWPLPNLQFLNESSIFFLFSSWPFCSLPHSFLWLWNKGCKTCSCRASSTSHGGPSRPVEMLMRCLCSRAFRVEHELLHADLSPKLNQDISPFIVALAGTCQVLHLPVTRIAPYALPLTPLANIHV